MPVFLAVAALHGLVVAAVVAPVVAEVGRSGSGGGSHRWPALLRSDGVDDDKLVVVKLGFGGDVFFFVGLGDGVDGAGAAFTVAVDRLELASDVQAVVDGGFACLHYLGSELVVQSGDEQLGFEELAHVLETFCLGLLAGVCIDGGRGDWHGHLDGSDVLRRSGG